MKPRLDPALLPPFALVVALCSAACSRSEEAGSPSSSGRSAAPPPAVTVEPAAQVDGSGEDGASADQTPATLRGVVRFEGTPPPRQPLAITGMRGCEHDGDPPLSEVVVVNEGMLQNCVVYVSRAPAGYEAPPPPEEPVHLDQKGCVYRPHVIAMRVGQTLRVSNSDPTSHNVHVYSRRTSVPNRTQPAGGQDLEIVFQRSEPPVKVGCDIHPWMGAWVGLFEHPFFAVSGPDGSFRIEGLPPGKHTLACWHERYDRQTVDVELPPGGAAELTFTFRGN